VSSPAPSPGIERDVGGPVVLADVAHRGDGSAPFTSAMAVSQLEGHGQSGAFHSVDGRNLVVDDLCR
jgi:hypothetical protein